MSNQIVLGNLTIDRAGYLVLVGDETVELTYLEFELLMQFARHPGKVLTRQELTRKLWPESPAGDSRRLDVHLARLRKKLRASKPWTIRTVTKRGYMLFKNHTSETIAPGGKMVVTQA